VRAGAERQRGERERLERRARHTAGIAQVGQPGPEPQASELEM
jgi:hypothetical protein